MVGIYLGDKMLDEITLGGQTVTEVYVGDVKVWPALPQRTYEEFLAHIATLAQQRVNSSNQILTSTRIYQLYNITKSGAMQGSPYSPNGRYRRVDSNHTYRRPIQHAVHSEAVFDTIVANGREILWSEGGGDLPGPYENVTRNGYTSTRYAFQAGGSELKRILYWDDIEGHAWEGLKTLNVAAIAYSRYDW